MKIKNIILDMGNVLLDYNPDTHSYKNAVDFATALIILFHPAEKHFKEIFNRLDNLLEPVE